MFRAQYIVSLSLGNRCRNRIIWNNEVEAEIVDLENNGTFHLIDFPDGQRNPNLLGDKNERENSQVLASGLIGAWLHQCVAENSHYVDLNELFETYSSKCEEQYVSYINSTPEYYGFDAKRVFYMKNHLFQEEECFRSSTAIYPFLSEEERDAIENLKEKYKQYIRNKYKELYPPTLKTFLSYFNGDQSIGYKSICEYLVEKYKEDTFKRNYPSVIPQYSKDETLQIVLECNNVDFSILRGNNNAIVEEIKNGLEQKPQHKDRERYIHTILNRLREFSELVYPINKIDQNREIIDHWKKRISEGFKQENCMQIIDNLQKDILLMQEQSDEFFNMPDFGQTIYEELYSLTEEEIARKFMSLYLDFVRRLDSLLMYYGIDLLEIERELDIYLCPPQEYFLLGGNEFYLTLTAAKKYYEELPKRRANHEAINSKFMGKSLIDFSIESVNTSDTKTNNKIYDVNDLDRELQVYISDTSKYNELAHLLNDTIKPHIDGLGNQYNWDIVAFYCKLYNLINHKASREKIALIFVKMVPSLGDARKLSQNMAKCTITNKIKLKNYDILPETDALKGYEKTIGEPIKNIAKKAGS